VPRTMDSRRLCCLIVCHGTYFQTEVHGRDARVSDLQSQLCPRIGAAAAPRDLTLYLARRRQNGGSDWLLSSGEEVYALALGDAMSDGDATVQRFLTAQNAMDPDVLLGVYFPEQPPLYHGTATTIHVLVWVGAAPKSMELIPREAVSADVTEIPSMKQTREWTATLIESFHRVRFGGGTTNGRSKSVAAPTVVRCVGPPGMLWLPDDSDPPAHDEWPKTSFYISQAWREVSAEIFRWVVTDPSRSVLFFTGDMKGHRALVTGAPRGGKSVFLAFLLLQLLRLRSPPLVIIVDVPGVTFARVDPRRGTVEEGSREVDFRAELSDVHSMYLFDVSSSSSDRVRPLSARDVYARSILIDPHQFNARATKRTQSFALPLWSLSDIQACTQLCFPSLAVPRVVALFHKWGGVPGRLFVIDPRSSERALETAIAGITARRVKTALRNVARTGAWAVTAAGDGGEAWRPLVVAVPGPRTHGYFAGDVMFTSQYVCDRVLQVSPLRTRVLRGLASPQQPLLSSCVTKSLAYLAQEEEEKHDETATMWARGGGWGAV
jgi:hypothetical protein